MNRISVLLATTLVAASCSEAPSRNNGADTAPGSDDAPSSSAAPCGRGPGRAYEMGAVEDVTNEPPCEIVFRPTGVRLTGVEDGSWPDPGWLVRKDGRGRYYSANADGWDGTIGVWDSDGSFLTQFGGRGGGPGEFSSRQLLLLIGRGDSLHVVEYGSWSVFSPDHQFVRRVSGEGIGTDPETTVTLHDGKILTGDGYSMRGRGYFQTIDADGATDTIFGTADEGFGGGEYGSARPIAYAPGHRSFWAAPSVEGAKEYVIEEWDARGKVIVQSLRRHQPWFEWTGEEITSAAVRILHATGDGLVYVQLWKPSEEFVEEMKPYTDRMEHNGGPGLGPGTDFHSKLEELTEQSTHIVIEVIDGLSAKLLVSTEYPAGEFLSGEWMLPDGFFPGGLTGYIYEVGEDGIPYVEIVEGVLEEK